MARIRTVKPELFRHEGLFEAEQETGLPLRLAFIGLFTVSDREGRFRWQPRQLKLDVMPYDSHDFSRVLDALMTRGFIVKYACSNEQYGAIPSFTRHQVINNREKASDFPSIEDADEVITSQINALSDQNPRVDDASVTPLEQDQGEGKGREQEGKGNRKGKGNDAHPEWFDSFWSLYPNKKGKEVARKAWDKIKPEGDLLNRIMEALGNHVRSADWMKDDGQFIPHPATWLNQKRWEDEIKPVVHGKHTGFADRDYHSGLFEKEDGSYGF